MGFRLPSLLQANKQRAQNPVSNTKDVLKGFLAVYVGEGSMMKRFAIPVSYLSQPSFQELLCQSEQEFGFDHPMGGLAIPCSEDLFVKLISRLNTQ